MKKLIFGIFAHPDDEAFGVSPTLIKFAHDGAEIHLITLTAGEHGDNPDNYPDLAKARLQEWRKGGKIMGASGMYYLGYTDGKMGNMSMIQAADKIESIVATVVAEQTEDADIDFITFEYGGITGHIDHIVASRAASLAFYRLKKLHPELFSRLLLRCLSEEHVPEHSFDWIYMEPGRPSHHIDLVVDAREHHDDIVRAIRAHHSQRGDGEMHIKNYGDQLGINYFVVKQ